MDKFICLVFSLYWIGNTFEMHILNWNLKLFWKNCEERGSNKIDDKKVVQKLWKFIKLSQWGINHLCLNTGVEKGEFYLVFAVTLLKSILKGLNFFYISILRYFTRWWTKIMNMFRTLCIRKEGLHENNEK